MNDFKDFLVHALTWLGFAMLLAIAAFLLVLAGGTMALNSMKQAAISKGAATWVSGEDGEPVFTWKECGE